MPFRPDQSALQTNNRTRCTLVEAFNRQWTNSCSLQLPSFGPRSFDALRVQCPHRFTHTSQNWTKEWIEVADGQSWCSNRSGGQ